MKNPRLPLVDLRLTGRMVMGAVALFATTALCAIESAQWQKKADIKVSAAGSYARIDLPAEVLDVALPGLADIRLLDPQGREAPFDFIRPADPVALRTLSPRYEVRLSDGATVVTVTTGTTDPLAFVAIEAAPGDFLKSGSVEISPDGEQWTSLARGLPLFRKAGSERMRVLLQNRGAGFIRITLDDRSTPPVAITGTALALSPKTVAPPRTVTQAVAIGQREEFAGETVLTLDLGAAHLTLTALEFESSTPAFSRSVTLTERRLENEVLTEHVIARGMISRSPGGAVDVLVVWTMGALTVSRELILHIDNGDSPPMSLTGLSLRRLKRELVFNADQAGAWTLFAGNPAAAAPRYDFARFSSALRVEPVEVAVERLTPNPEYQALPDTLAGVVLPGAALDPLAWKFRRPVVLGGAGVQQLKLDLATLARAQTDLADIRLISDGRQIPYLIERSNLSREFAGIIEPADDPKQPATSRWRVKLPQSGLPLRRLVMASSTPLFQRQIRFFEPVTDERGQESLRPISEISWIHRPGLPTANLTLYLDRRLAGDTIVIETENGDNPPIALDAVRATVGVTRLLFKPSAETAAPEIIYGNSQVAPARYDLVLIAPQILGARKYIATLGEEVSTASSLDLFSGRGSVMFFWGVLALVVVLLLVIVARLLPKPEAEKPAK
jgi:hypothetical protein